MSTPRRSLLTCLPATFVPAAAQAFRMEPPSAAVAAEYGGGCDATETHEALRAEMSRLLDGRPLPPELEPRLASLSRCPFCGCAVVGRADHGEGERP